MGPALRAILIAGFTCGILDGLSAVALAGGRWMRLFQFVASGALGPDAFNGGTPVALLGIAFHFTVAFAAATAYYSLSRIWPVLLHHPLICGPLFGLAVHLFMNLAVIPLSKIGWRPLWTRGFLNQVFVHMIVVGPSIALTIARMGREEP